LFEGRFETIVLQILNGPLGELRYVFDADDLPWLAFGGKEMMENGGEITGTASDIEDSSAGFEDGEEVFACVCVLCFESFIVNSAAKCP
jgi:hypothetical protein